MSNRDVQFDATVIAFDQSIRALCDQIIARFPNVSHNNDKSKEIDRATAQIRELVGCRNEYLLGEVRAALAAAGRWSCKGGEA